MIHLTREINFILGAWHPSAQRYSVLALFRDEAPWMRVDGRFQMQTKHFAAGLINVNRHPIVMEVHWKVLHGPACPSSAHEKPPGTWPWAAVVHHLLQTTRFTRCVNTDSPQNLTIFSLLFTTSSSDYTLSISLFLFISTSANMSICIDQCLRFNNQTKCQSHIVKKMSSCEIFLRYLCWFKTRVMQISPISFRYTNNSLKLSHSRLGKSANQFRHHLPQRDS